MLNPPPGFENAWTSSRQSVVRSDNDGKQHTSIFERNIAKSDQEGKRIALAPINDLSNCKHTRKKIHHNHQQYDAINNDISIQYEKKNIIECKTNYRMDDDQDDEKKLLHEIFTTKRNKYATKGNTAVISKMKYSNVKPTWVIPHPSKNVIYIAGNGSNEIIEVDSDSWRVSKRIKTGKGPYNVEISPDGKYMIATLKSIGSTGIWDLDSGKLLSEVKNSTSVSHGIAISPDSKYAFISVEGIGGEPGIVDVIDIKSQTLIDNVEIGKQAGGIAFWKMEI